jgi:hypothetical protein
VLGRDVLVAVRADDLLHARRFARHHFSESVRRRGRGAPTCPSPRGHCETVTVTAPQAHS